METIVCPYCQCRVLVHVVDAEGGMCPECGAGIISAGMTHLNDSFDDESDDEGQVRNEEKDHLLDEDLDSKTGDDDDKDFLEDDL